MKLLDYFECSQSWENAAPHHDKYLHCHCTIVDEEAYTPQMIQEENNEEFLDASPYAQNYLDYNIE